MSVQFPLERSGSCMHSPTSEGYGDTFTKKQQNLPKLLTFKTWCLHWKRNGFDKLVQLSIGIRSASTNSYDVFPCLHLLCGLFLHYQWCTVVSYYLIVWYSVSKVPRKTGDIIWQKASAIWPYIANLAFEIIWNKKQILPSKFLTPFSHENFKFKSLQLGQI